MRNFLNDSGRRVRWLVCTVLACIFAVAVGLGQTMAALTRPQVDLAWFNRAARRSWWREATRGFAASIREAYWRFLFRFYRLRPVMGGATLVAARSPLYYAKTPGGIPAIVDVREAPANIFYVDSATGTDAAGYGTHPDKPVATIAYAVSLCTANQGDVVVVMPGHAETIAAVSTIDKAGVTIIGLGEGNTRPAITVSDTIDGFSLEAADVVVENLRFVTPSGVATAQINIAAARCVVRRCGFAQGANSRDAITVTAAGELPTIEDCDVIVTANGPTSFVIFQGVVDRPVIRRNTIIGSDGTNAYDVGMIDCNNQILTNLFIRDNTFGDGNAAVTVFAQGGNVVGEAIGPNSYAALATNADTTGVTLASFAGDSITAAVIAAGAIDAGSIAADAITAAKIAAGAIDAATFAAGAIDAAAIAADAIDAGAIAADAITNAKIADAALAAEQFALSAGEKTTDGVVVTKAAAALPQTTSAAIFTVTGNVVLKRIVGNITVAVGAVPNATKLKVNSTGVGATTDICGTLDINNKVADTRLEITGTFANAMVATVDVPLALVQAANIVIPPGTIEVDCAGSDGGGGRVKWSATYVPLEAGAQIVAA